MASSEHPYTLVEDEGDASETPRSAWPAQDDGRHQSFVGLRGAVSAAWRGSNTRSITGPGGHSGEAGTKVPGLYACIASARATTHVPSWVG